MRAPLARGATKPTPSRTMEIATQAKHQSQTGARKSSGAFGDGALGDSVKCRDTRSGKSKGVAAANLASALPCTTDSNAFCFGSGFDCSGLGLNFGTSGVAAMALQTGQCAMRPAWHVSRSVLQIGHCWFDAILELARDLPEKLHRIAEQPQPIALRRQPVPR